MTWFTSSGMRRLGCTCDFNDAPGMRCQDDVLRCNGAVQAQPSVDRLMHWMKDVDEDMAKAVMAIITGTIDVDELPQFDELYREMHGEPSKIMVIDKLIGTCGVEIVSIGEEADFDSPVFAYCNTGDMYVRTVVEYEGEFYLASYEDCRKSAASIQQE